MTDSHVLCTGLSTVDLVQRVAELPGANEKVTADDAELLAGGPATGAALAAAALGSSVTLLTALGRHRLADLVRDELSGAGIDVLDAAPRVETPPPVSAVSVRESTGERSVVSRNAQDAGAVSGYDLFGDPVADAVLIDGHHERLAESAVRYAAGHGVPVVLDAGSWKPVLERVLDRVDLAVCSADFRAPGTTGVSEQPAALMRRGVRAVAVTRGGDDVLWWRADERGSSGTVTVPRVRVVDTLGAGDVFHGAVARAVAMRSRERSWFEQLPEVLEYAARAGAVRVEHAGRREWLAALRALR